MPNLIATITRVVDEDFPGWVEVRFLDVAGHEHVIVEKIPAISVGGIDTTALPARIGVRCTVVEIARDPLADEIVVIDTSAPFGIETIDGQTRFAILATQLELFCPRCGATLDPVEQGESRCLATGALISSELTALLRDRFVLGRNGRAGRTASLTVADDWFCPGCSSKLHEGACQQCAARLDDLIYRLVELNPHPKGF